MLKWPEKMKNDRCNSSAIDLIRRTIADVPVCNVATYHHPTKDTDGVELLVELSTPQGAKTIAVEEKNNGQPRYARQAVDRLRLFLADHPQAYGLFIAPYISPRAAEICDQHRIGYLDHSGNCRINFDQLYIHKQGNPNAFAQKRETLSLYSAKATRVLRVLLATPHEPWKMEPLSTEAKVSLGTVHSVKTKLADREWITSDKAGLSLSHPAELLLEWAKHYRAERNTTHQYYSMFKVGEIEARLAETCEQENTPYALTDFSAAARMAPSVRYNRVACYIDGAADQIAKRLSLKEVTTGANVNLITPYDAGVFYGASDIGGINTVSPAQAYLDLITKASRGAEAAEVLLSEIIKPKWQASEATIPRTQ